MVEKTGLEPVTSRKPSGRTTKLCYIPKRPKVINQQCQTIGSSPRVEDSNPNDSGFGDHPLIH